MLDFSALNALLCRYFQQKCLENWNFLLKTGIKRLNVDAIYYTNTTIEFKADHLQPQVEIQAFRSHRLVIRRDSSSSCRNVGCAIAMRASARWRRFFP